MFSLPRRHFQFVGREEIRSPLKMPAGEANKCWAVKRALRSSCNVLRSRTGTSALSALQVRSKAGEIFLFANRKSYFLSVISGYNVK